MARNRAGLPPALRGGSLLAVLVTLVACGAAGPSTGSASGPAGPGDGVAAPGSGVGTSTPGPTVTRASADGHVCLGRATKDAWGAELPRLDQRPRLGPGEPVRLVRCRPDTQRVAGQGEWEVRVEEQAGAGAPALAATLRLPDEEPSGQICAAYADQPPDLWAVDAAGHAVLVREPVDECAHIRAEVKHAIDRAGWSETGRRRLTQTAPQAALDARCETGWKDMVVIEARSAAAEGRPVRPGTADLLAKLASGRVCVYAVGDRQTPEGSFVSGRALPAAQWAAVVAALDAGPPLAARCDTLGTRFALVIADTGDPAYVELDGCRRVLLPDRGFRQATPALVRLLAVT